MMTVKLKGPGLNDYFAEQLVNDCGADEARKRSSGPMLEAVERVIRCREDEAKKSIRTPDWRAL
jgi:hypothetical protein